MNDISGSTTIEQETVKEEEPVAIPLIGGSMNLEEIKANFNALLYLMTENMGIQLKLMEALVQKEVLTADDMNEKVLSVTGDKEELTLVYNEMFSRFVGYYTSLRQLMADGKVFEMKGDENVDDSKDESGN